MFQIWTPRRVIDCHHSPSTYKEVEHFPLIIWRAIARGLALELPDRDTRSVEGHRIASNDPLHGLDPESTL